MSYQTLFIQNLHQARIDNTKWVAMVKILTVGLPTKEYLFEPTLLDTNFGKWFYKEAMLLSQTNCRAIIDQIELTLLSMYQNFITIYEITILDRKKTFLGKPKPLTTIEKETLQTFYLTITELSSTFQKQLDRFEKILNAKSQKEFDILSSVYE